MAIVHELLRSGHVDVEYLSCWTNAAYLVDQTPGERFGLFVRHESDRPLIWDRATERAEPFDKAGTKPALKGTYSCPSGCDAIPVFELLARKYLEAEYAPEAVADRCGITAATIKRLAAQLAHVAFEDEFEIAQPWTDFRGERHEKIIGRSVSFHAMRGIWAHSNGFQTCRALHILQLLLGAVERPGSFRFKPPYPKPMEAHPTPHSDLMPGGPLSGPHLGFPRSPSDLLLNRDGSAKRIDKAFTWENPLSVHGMMHMVIPNAHAGDPYSLDVLFMYMANMGWNSSMNTAGVIEMLKEKQENGDYKIPKIIYSDAYSSEMVAFADLVLPDTTYLERHDCISLLDRPIGEIDAACDAIRWPVVEPDRDVRGFQSVLLELGSRLGLAGFVDDEGNPKYKDYADYMVNHQRRPGVGPLAGWRGDGTGEGRGDPNPDQLQMYIDNGGFWECHIPDEALFMKPFNQAYQSWAVDRGFFDKPLPYVFQLYVEPIRRFQLAAEGHGDIQPPDFLRDRVKKVMDPLPIWWEPLEQAATDTTEFPLFAITQRPAAMYHAWGSQNAWLRQIHGENSLYVPSSVMDEHGLTDGDWAWVSSSRGRIKVPVRRMAAVNQQTLWTWNAIGKREGAWALGEGAPETRRGFLLNHLIMELLPPRDDDHRWSNSDPTTGQAAWFDLRVKIEKAEPSDASEPRTGSQKSPVGRGPNQIAYGEEWS